MLRAQSADCAVRSKEAGVKEIFTSNPLRRKMRARRPRSARWHQGPGGDVALQASSSDTRATPDAMEVRPPRGAHHVVRSTPQAVEPGHPAFPLLDRHRVQLPHDRVEGPTAPPGRT